MNDVFRDISMMQNEQVAALRAEVDRLNRVIDRMAAVPGDHRDWLLTHPPMRWSSKSMEVARDTCDVIHHKIREARLDPSAS